MPKTYNTIPSVATGDVLTAAAWNAQATNVNNYRVPPMCRVFRNAALSHTSTGGYQTVSFDAESFTNTDDMWVIGSPTRITIKTAGVYLITASAAMVTVGTGIRVARIFVNNATVACESGHINNLAYAGYNVLSTTWNFAANDYVELSVFQNSGGNLAYNAAAGYTFMSATWLGQVS